MKCVDFNTNKITKETLKIVIFSNFGSEIKEIEIVIESHPWVVEVAIIQKPDQESKTNGITAYVVTSQPVKLSELTKFCKQELESYKIPSLIIFLEKLPKTWSGEVEKYKLT